jgi:hypothetical protein
VTYLAPQAAGDTNILAIGWNDATSTITSVTDSAGNTYQVATPVARGSALSQAIYYAKNITAAAAGANTVTVVFNTAVRYADVRILEYGGLDTVAPLDVSGSAAGTTLLANSGGVTTSSANELIVGAGITVKRFITPGSGFTARLITSPNGDIVEDRTTTIAGSYAATATLKNAGAWLMQVATFRAAGP